MMQPPFARGVIELLNLTSRLSSSNPKGAPNETAGAANTSPMIMENRVNCRSGWLKCHPEGMSKTLSSHRSSYKGFVIVCYPFRPLFLRTAE